MVIKIIDITQQHKQSTIFVYNKINKYSNIYILDIENSIIIDNYYTTYTNIEFVVSSSCVVWVV